MAQRLPAHLLVVPRLDFADLVVDQPRERAGKHQRADAAGEEHRERRRGAAAHRVGEHREFVDAEMIQQRVQVEGEGPPAGAARHVAAEAEAAVVERHDPEVLGERRHLLPPDEMIAARAVGQHERGRVIAAVAFVPEVDLVAAQVGHTSDAPLRRARRR